MYSYLFCSKEVRNLAKTAVNATSDDEIIFCDGSYTSPIERLCYLLCSSSNTNNSPFSNPNASNNNNNNGSASPTAIRLINSPVNGMSGNAISESFVREMYKRDTCDSSGDGSGGGGLKTSFSTNAIPTSMSPPPPMASPSPADGPILFVSTCEIVQNLQPWIDAGAQIERISKNREGFLNLDDLSKSLAKYQNSGRRLIGLFSAASRLTGILADDVATTILLHQFGAISVWDYSYAAPFAPINTNPPLPGAAKDVVFFTTSKFIGGVQAPGKCKRHPLWWSACGVAFISMGQRYYYYFETKLKQQFHNVFI